MLLGLSEKRMFGSLEGMFTLVFRAALNEAIESDLSTSVPAMVSDLIESQLAGYGLETLLFGGAPAHDQLPAKAKHAFPTAVMYVRNGGTKLEDINSSFLSGVKLMA